MASSHLEELREDEGQIAAHMPLDEFAKKISSSIWRFQTERSLVNQLSQPRYRSARHCFVVLLCTYLLLSKT
jgi:hypothetical protein